MTIPATAEDARTEIAREYGTYVATDVIYVNGARAFNPGDPVPVSHVDSGVVAKELVARTGTKAAAAVTDTTEKG